MNDEIIKNRIGQLSPEYRKFVVGDFVDATVRTYSEAFNLDQERGIIFENGLMLYLLMIIDQQKLIEFMHQECDFTLESAQKIVTDIIANLPPSLVYAIHQSYEELNTEITEPAATSPQDPISPSQDQHVPVTSNLAAGTNNPGWQPVGQATPPAQPVTYQTPQPAYQATVPPPPYTPPQPTYQAPQAPYVPPQPTYQSPVTPLTPVGAPVGQSYAQPPVTPPPQAAQPYTPPSPVYGQVPTPPPQRPYTVAEVESRMPPLPTTHTPPQASRFNALNEAPITPPPATTIQPVRTMEEDVERIHGYAAYRQQYPHLYTDEESTKATVRGLAQDALLQRTPVVETPRFDEPRG
jgi:hypothetical protein